MLPIVARHRRQAAWLEFREAIRHVRDVVLRQANGWRGCVWNTVMLEMVDISVHQVWRLRLKLRLSLNLNLRLGVEWRRSVRSDIALM